MNERQTLRGRLYWLIGGFFLIFLDQFSKYLVINRGLPFYYNRFGFLGLFENFSWLQSMSYWLLIFLIFYWFKKEINLSLLKKTSLFLLVVGGISNQIDKIFRPGVVDFIDLKIWPLFNFADIYIVGGVLLISCFLISHST